MSSISIEDYDPVEDCLDHCSNHFTLAYEVARRSHLILRRGDALVPENNDRVVVVALREVAGGHTAVPPMKIDTGGNEVQDDEPAELIDTGGNEVQDDEPAELIDTGGNEVQDDEPAELQDSVPETAEEDTAATE